MFWRAMPVDRVTGLALPPKVVMALLKVAVSPTAFGKAADQLEELFQLASAGEADQVPLRACTLPVRQTAMVSVARADWRRLEARRTF